MLPPINLLCMKPAYLFYKENEVPKYQNRIKQQDACDEYEMCGKLLTSLCHGLAKEGGWWNDIESGEPLDRNKGELLCLIHSEISEALEGVRKDLPDEKLPHRRAEEVELADTLIRIFDYAGGFGLDIAGALVEKLQYNQNRADHKIENRLADHGKKF